MATSSAWVSVVVKSYCGQNIQFPRSIVKHSWDDQFGFLVMKVGGHDMEGRAVHLLVFKASLCMKCTVTRMLLLINKGAKADQLNKESQ